MMKDEENVEKAWTFDERGRVELSRGNLIGLR